MRRLAVEPPGQLEIAVVPMALRDAPRPRRLAPGRDAGVKGRPAGYPPGMGPCVLVADDSRELAEMLRATLEEAGFEVATAYSGPAAVAALRDRDVAVAVLDVLMPGLSGDAVAETVQRLKPDLPILLMTGDAGQAFVDAAGLPVLHKPFRHEELVGAVNRLLEPR